MDSTGLILTAGPWERESMMVQDPAQVGLLHVDWEEE